MIYLLEESQPRLLDNFEVSVIRVEHLYIFVIDHTVDDNTVPPFWDHYTAKLSRLYWRLRHDITIRNKFIWVTVSAKDQNEKPCFVGCRRWIQRNTQGFRRIQISQSPHDRIFRTCFNRSFTSQFCHTQTEMAIKKQTQTSNIWTIFLGSNKKLINED